MFQINNLKQAGIVIGVFMFMANSAFALEIKEIGSYKLGNGEGFAEMLRYHSNSKSLMVTSSETGTIERLSIQSVSNISKMNPLDLSGGDVTAVAIHKDMIAASIKGDTANAPGVVKLFDANGEEVSSYKTGPLPDNVAFSPDGRYLLTANEGEPSDDYSIDPEGSFTLIDLGSGADNAKVTQISLAGFETPIGGRVVKPGASFAADAEPEYIAFDTMGQTAYVTLQENNSVAVIDVVNAKVASIVGLGVKNVSRKSHDMSNKDNGINMKRWPVLMLSLIHI